MRYLRSLAGECSPEALDLLSEALGDAAWRVRKAAVESLVACPERGKVTDILAEALACHENANRRNSAHEAFVRLGAPAIPDLDRLLKSEDAEVRKFAVDILGEIGDPESLPLLMGTAADPDENVRIAAVEGLGRIGSPKSVEVLLAMLERGDTLLSYTVLEALAKAPARLPVAPIRAAAENKILRKAAFHALGNGLNPEALEFFLEGLKDNVRGVREAAVTGLSRLFEGLKDDDAREKAALAAAGMKDEVSLDLIAAGLDAESPEVRRSTALVLGLLGDPAAVEPLFREIGYNPDSDDAIRWSLAALGRLEEGLERIISEVDSADPEASRAAHKILGELDGPRVVEILKAGLVSEVGHVRAESARSLGRKGAQAAAPEILPLLEDPYPDVRQAAVYALSMLGVENKDSLKPILHNFIRGERPVAKRGAIEIAGVLDLREEMHEIAQALKDPSPEVRRTAAEALGRLGCEGALDGLLVALTDEEPKVRAAVLGALETSRSPAASQALEKAVGDQDSWVANFAIEALRRRGEAGAAPALVEVVRKRPNGLLVVSALEALAELAPTAVREEAERLVEDVDVDVALAALKVVVALEGDLGRRILEKLLDHEHWHVRLTAARHLSRYDNAEARSVLARRLDDERDPLVLKALREALEA